MADKREYLKSVFIDTLSHAQELSKSETTKHTFFEILPWYQMRKDVRSGVSKDNISVINSDSVSALTEYSKLGKTCVLNMASAKRPGGGVENGASAQEECLFRCSNLWTSIDPSFYQLKTDECLYTKDAIFFKDKDYNYMDDVKSDVITIAAYNLNEISHFFGKKVARFDDLNKTIDYEKNTKDKIRLMLSVPAKNGVQNLILGAWGCGVYKNDPEKMATYFKDILMTEGYNLQYKNVVFAVINDHNSVGNNFEIFSKILGK